jgi:hypothetical protein
MSEAPTQPAPPSAPVADRLEEAAAHNDQVVHALGLLETVITVDCRPLCDLLREAAAALRAAEQDAARLREQIEAESDAQYLLRCEVDTLRKDGARLDWLEAHRPPEIVAPDGDDTEWVVFLDDEWENAGQAPTLRAAIDAARKP